MYRPRVYSASGVHRPVSYGQKHQGSHHIWFSTPTGQFLYNQLPGLLRISGPVQYWVCCRWLSPVLLQHGRSAQQNVLLRLWRHLRALTCPTDSRLSVNRLRLSVKLPGRACRLFKCHAFGKFPYLAGNCQNKFGK